MPCFNQIDARKQKTDFVFILFASKHWAPITRLVIAGWLATLVGGTNVATAQGGGNANAVANTIETQLAPVSGSGSPPSGATPEGAIAPVAAPSSDAGSSSSTGTPPMSSTPMSSEPMSSSSGSSSSYDGSSSSYGSSGSPDGHGDSYGYGGGQNASSAVQRGQIAMSAAVTQVAQSLASFFAPATAGKPLVSSKLSLWEEAAIAFHNGDQRRALALYHAHVVADGESANKARAAVSYSRLLKRPVWAVRFGISVHARVPNSLATDPQPIREGMQLTGVTVRNAAGAGAAPGAAGGQQIANAAPPVAMSDPREIAVANNSSFSSSDGAVSSDGSSSFGAETKPARVVTTLGGAGTEEALKAVDANLGIIADIVKTLFDQRFAAGKFGNAFQDMEAAGAKLARDHAGDGFSSSDTPMWTPGIDYLGVGTAPEMLELAKKNEIDVLLHFDVVAKENKVASPPYMARGRLVLVSTGETLGVSKAIDKFEVAGRRLTVRDAVSELLVNLFEIIDKRCAVEPMPALQTTHAIARIDALLGAKSTGSMYSLAEMAMFRSRELITDKQLDQAFYFAAGEEGLRLIHDEDVSRYETAKMMIDRELTGKEPE